MTIPVTSFRDGDAIAAALAEGALVAVPDVGGYSLAVRADLHDASSRLVAYGPTASAAHCLLVGSQAQARGLVGTWSADTQQLMVRCWPGPLTIVVATEAASGTLRLRMPSPRALRHLVRDSGPWLVQPLGVASVSEVQDRCAGHEGGDAVAAIIDGGRCVGPGPTVVDATGPVLRTVEEGALPADFIEGAMLMGGRRRWFRSRSAERDRLR
jgi:tRNA A37 threonylcarbamoyladenosine synthetase subunit TsaC/SUA5/YrdC